MKVFAFKEMPRSGSISPLDVKAAFERGCKTRNARLVDPYETHEGSTIQVTDPAFHSYGLIGTIKMIGYIARGMKMYHVKFWMDGYTCLFFRNEFQVLS